ncbi:ADP-ribose pyrophosphatase [Aciduliprofundum sp. MAR08-339]|uniref:NUDIX hydrolase n=1 Tax=Aciduliprofundum sp. (strain MAR08-339) TaxID=673860 RepID=UPI0002A4B2DB|nr:ADP-ribose pyrophosphatase [Aciduliprofundum sp. MAR08-339]
MNIERSEIVFKGNFLRIRRDYNGNAIWESVEIGKHTKTAVVIALTENKEILLEKHYRFPLNMYVIELPAGLVDDEDPEECARRELLEETGYRAEELVFLFKGVICQGLTRMEAYYFYAPDVKMAARQNLEPTEEIEVIKVPLVHVDEYLFSLPEDLILGANVLSGIYALKRYLGKC